MKFIILTLLSLVPLGCDSNVEIADLQIAKDPNEATTKMSLVLTSSFTVQAEDTLKFSGRTFQASDTYVALFVMADESQAKIPVTIESESVGAVTVPEGLKVGINYFSLTEADKPIGVLSFLYHELGEELAFNSGSLAKLCTTDSFVNHLGAKVTGTKDCATGTVVDCAGDNEVGCVATSDFPTVDKTLALATNIKDGITLAGVTGSVEEAPADCSLDGETACVTTPTYKAVEISGLAAKVKNGVTVAGETGTYPSSGNLLTGASEFFRIVAA